MKKIKIYLAGKIYLVERHNEIKKFLEENLECEVFVPHELVPLDIPKDKLPIEVFEKCVEHMKKADVIVADVEDYGKDTAWEVGFCHGVGKPVIAFTKNDSFKSDFMVKGVFSNIAESGTELIEIIKGYDSYARTPRRN